MEITIDLYKVGYFVGRYGTKAMIYFSQAKLALSGYRFAKKVSVNHKIDSNSVEAVSNNLFECLQYID